MIAEYIGKLYPDLTLSISLKRSNYTKLTENTAKKVYKQKIEKTNQEKPNLSEGAILGSPTEFSQPKKRNGLNGLTAHGKRAIRNIALLMEREYGKGRLSMITPTLPNYDFDNLEVINRNFHELIRYFNQRVRRFLKSINKPLDMIACVELQPKRLKKRKEVAPHLHMLLVVRNGIKDKEDYLTEERLNSMWILSIEDTLRRFGGNLSQKVKKDIAVHSRPIEASAIQYMAKYMSKHKDDVDYVIKLEKREELPMQWWCCSKESRAKYIASIQTVNEQMAEAIYNNLEASIENGSLLWGIYIETEYKGKMIRVGCSCKFTEEQLHLWQDIYGQVNMAS